MNLRLKLIHVFLIFRVIFGSAMGKKADRRSSSRLVSQILSRDFNERIEVANKRSGLYWSPALKLLEEE